MFIWYVRDGWRQRQTAILTQLLLLTIARCVIFKNPRYLHRCISDWLLGQGSIHNRNTWVLVQEIPLHSRQTCSRNEQMPTRSTHSRMDDQKKDHLDPKRPKQRNRSKQLQTHNLPIDDAENIYSTNKRSDLLLANKPWIVSWGADGCRKGSRGTVELLYIDQHILIEGKTRRKDLALAWIDCKTAYNMVPQSWIINCLKMYKISNEVINFIEKTMKTMRVELTAGGRSLAEAKIQRDIF